MAAAVSIETDVEARVRNDGFERRRGTDRRQRRELVVPWQGPEWDSDWTGPERRIEDRRSRSAAVLPPIDERPVEPERYSDDWARARGQESFADWIEFWAAAPPPGLPEPAHAG